MKYSTLDVIRHVCRVHPDEKATVMIPIYRLRELLKMVDAMLEERQAADALIVALQHGIERIARKIEEQGLNQDGECSECSAGSEHVLHGHLCVFHFAVGLAGGKAT